MDELLNIDIDEIFDIFYIRVTKKTNGKEYTEPLGFDDLKKASWVNNLNDLLAFIILKNNCHKYTQNCFSMCFQNKENAQIVVDKLLAMYTYYKLKEE